MIRFGAASSRLERFTSGFSLEMAEPHLPSKMVAEIAQQGQRPGERRRSLPRELVAWLVIGGALRRQEGLRNVLSLLGRGVGVQLDWARQGGPPPTSAAITRARVRLGVRPLRRIFERMVALWRQRHGESLRWRGMAPVGLDGTTLRMPDTPENRAHFGTHRTGKKLLSSAYPYLRAVVALCGISHIALACVVGRSHTSEWALGRALVRKLPSRSLLLLDRGFMGNAFLRDLLDAGHEFVVRAKRRRRLHEKGRLGPGDRLVDVHLMEGRRCVRTLRLRAIEYQIPGFDPVKLLTSLTDPYAYPAREIAARYRERWEAEITFDEIKTHLLGKDVPLRSKSPMLVRQEVDGILIAHSLVRMHMAQAARRADLSAVGLSYTDCLVRLRDLQIRMAQASARRLPELMERALADLATCVLPPRRPRRYPRTVKASPCRYPLRGRDRAA